MYKNKKIMIFVVSVALVLGASIATQVFADSNLSMTQHSVEFSNFVNKDSIMEDGDYTLSSMKSDEDLMYLETKSAKILTKDDGSEYELNMSSFQNGIATYNFEAVKDTLYEDNINVISPVLYVEEKNNEEALIPLRNSSNSIDVEVSDSKERFPDAEQGVLVEFTATDIEHLPYNMVLVSDGKVFDNCAVSYYFDIETGDFTNGYLIFFDITMDELSEDASLKASSTFNRYVPTDFNVTK